MIISFGKYKGKSLEWIYFNDKSYFEWLENNSKSYIQEAIAEFRLRLERTILENQKQGMRDARKIINIFLEEHKQVRAVNVHGVGFEFRLGDLSIEDILNRDFTLRYYKNNKLISIDLTREQYRELYLILREEWRKHTELWEERGLY